MYVCRIKKDHRQKYWYRAMELSVPENTDLIQSGMYLPALKNHAATDNFCRKNK